jgi:hypothetical protein
MKPPFRAGWRFGRHFANNQQPPGRRRHAPFLDFFAESSGRLFGRTRHREAPHFQRESRPPEPSVSAVPNLDNPFPAE